MKKGPWPVSVFFNFLLKKYVEKQTGIIFNYKVYKKRNMSFSSIIVVVTIIVVVIITWLRYWELQDSKKPFSMFGKGFFDASNHTAEALRLEYKSLFKKN